MSSRRESDTYASKMSEIGNPSTTTTPELLPFVSFTLKHCVALLAAAVVTFVGYATHGTGAAPPRQFAYSVGTAGQGFVEYVLPAIARVELLWSSLIVECAQLLLGPTFLWIHFFCQIRFITFIA